MTVLLWIGGAVFALLVLRFVQPTLVHRVHEFVVRTTINRMLLEAAEEGAPAPTNFGALLSLQLRTESAPLNHAAMELRCHKLREVMAVLTTGEHEGRAHDRIGTGVVELADMVTILGNRFRPGAEEREEIVDAERLLQLVVRESSPNGFASLPPGADAATLLRLNPISIVQLSEMLIAIVYALIAREQWGRRGQEPSMSNPRHSFARVLTPSSPPRGQLPVPEEVALADDRSG